MAWFTFTDASGETFVIRLTDPNAISHARSLLAGMTDADSRIGGVVEKTAAHWNIGWSYHLEPDSVFFFEMSTEVGDATMRYLENHLDQVGGELLPGSVWTGWSSTLLAELDAEAGTADCDRLEGTGRADLLFGRAGADRLLGRAGDDHLVAGAGADFVLGGHGKDKIAGGGGNDLLSGGRDDDLVLGDAGRDRLYGDAGRDVLSGGVGTDVLDGGSGSDDLWGEAGDDFLKGGHGPDRLRGGHGDDAVWGGAGADELTGGPGCDWLFGGADGDVFRFPSIGTAGLGSDRDVICDFETGRDRIDLRFIDAIPSAPGHQALRFIGAEPFGGRGGEVRMSNGILAADIDGDGQADFQIALLAIDQLTGSELLI